jgi:hypothetical protein
MYEFLKSCRLTACIFAVSLTVGLTAEAEPVDAWWHTVDTGGAMHSAGSGPPGFRLSGTVGQPDACTPMTGAKFSLVGGFWSGSGKGLVDGACGDGDADGDGIGDACDPVIDPSPNAGDVGSNNDNDAAGSDGADGNGDDGSASAPQSQPAGPGAPDCGAGVCGTGSLMPLMMTCVAMPLLRRRCYVHR